jgi:hypothetical protein
VPFFAEGHFFARPQYLEFIMPETPTEEQEENMANGTKVLLLVVSPAQWLFINECLADAYDETPPEEMN